MNYSLNARTEIHSFKTCTLTNKEFLTGVKNGPTAMIGGVLSLPPGKKRFLVVVLVHGSAGVGANVDRWARELNDIGVATFLLDCFTGRGVAETITDQGRVGHLAMIADAYRAFELLSMHDRVDAARIAVMGFSKGGFAALYSSLKRFQRMHAPDGSEFAAYIAFYPPCNTVFLDDLETSTRPIRLFHGTADNYVSIDPCREYVEKLRSAGRDVVLTEYEGAHHVFDNPQYSRAVVLPDALTTNRCLLEERAEGEIVNTLTNRPFSMTDSCVSRGATLSYDPAATAEATKAVKELVGGIFELRAQVVRS